MLRRRIPAVLTAIAVVASGLTIATVPAAAVNTAPTSAVFGASAAVDVQRTPGYPTCTPGTPNTYDPFSVRSTGNPISQSAFNDTLNYTTSRVNLSAVPYYNGTTTVTTAAELKVSLVSSAVTPNTFALKMYIAGTNTELTWDTTGAGRWSDQAGGDSFSETGYVYALYSGGFLHEGLNTRTPPDADYNIGTFLMIDSTLPTGSTLTYTASPGATDNICNNSIASSYRTYATSTGMASSSLGGSGTITTPDGGTVASDTPLITISINDNGGTCTTRSVTGFLGSWTNAPSSFSCFKPGALFTGFNTKADGSGLAVAPGGNLNLTGDNTLYAIYDSPQTAGAPTDVVATAGLNKVSVSWKAPVDPGSSAITNYLAQATPSGKVCVTRLSDANMLSCNFDLPATNTKYSFKVQALNGAGWGSQSTASAAVSPYDFRDITASRPNILFGLGGSRVEASGSAPGLAGKAVNAQFKVGSAKDWTTETKAATVNAQGKFSWSKKFGSSFNKQNVTVRFTYGPDLVSGAFVLSRGGQTGSLTAPRNIKVENAVNRVIVTWDPPKFDGGEKITGYTMCANGAGSLCRNVSAEGRAIFQNLATGRDYTITVAAKTAARTGPAAEANRKVSPVEASAQITRRIGEEITVQTRAIGFKDGSKFRLEAAVVVFGKPVDTWRWDELQSFTGKGNVNRLFSEELGASYEGETIAVRLVTPNGSVYSRVSRP